MKQLIRPLLLLVLTVGLVASHVAAQNVAGQYEVTVSGANYYMDRTPVKANISDTTTMTISQDGHQVTVSFGSFAGSSAATMFKGKVGNNQICAVWWYEGSPHETKVLWGTVNGGRISGHLMYPRVAPRAGLVPGWTEITFKAKKKVTAAQPSLKEDCIPFDYRRLEVKRIGGRWKIVEGDHWLLDFGGKKNEAEQALKIIKHYRMNSQCFVGRPDPSMTYCLVDGRAPTGPAPGEDCVSHNLGNLQVKNVNGRWKIVDGAHWLMDFNDKEDEARTALKIIKKYGFTRHCFVGRPDPSFEYWRK